MKQEKKDTLLIASLPLFAIIILFIGMGDVVTGILFAIGIAVFITPLVIAYMRDLRNANAIAVINIFGSVPLIMYGFDVTGMSLTTITEKIVMNMGVAVTGSFGVLFTAIGWVAALVMALWNEK